MVAIITTIVQITVSNLADGLKTIEFKEVVISPLLPLVNSNDINQIMKYTESYRKAFYDKGCSLNVYVYNK